LSQPALTKSWVSRKRLTIGLHRTSN
jgi:hypothetical protein